MANFGFVFENGQKLLIVWPQYHIRDNLRQSEWASYGK